METRSRDSAGVRVHYRSAGKRGSCRAGGGNRSQDSRHHRLRSDWPIFNSSGAGGGGDQSFAIEDNGHRRQIAKEMHADFVLDPSTEDVRSVVMEKTDGLGLDVVLEMAGHPSAIRTAFDIVRRGGRISLLGLTSKPISLNFSDDIIFKGITVQGINGRRMYQTLVSNDCTPQESENWHPSAITDRMAMTDFSKGMDRLKTGEASKILLYPNGNH